MSRIKRDVGKFLSPTSKVKEMTMKVFLHGVPDTAHMWTPLITELGLSPTEYETLSLPGFGCLVPAGFKTTKSNYATWLIGELERIVDAHCGPINLVGHDWGAILTARVASLRPDLIKSLVFGGAAIDGAYRGHLFAWMWATPVIGELFMAISNSGTMKKSLMEQGLPEDLATHEASAFDATMKRSILQLYRSAAGLRGLGVWEKELENLPAKKLLIWGEKDPFVPLAVGERFVSRWGGTLHIEKDIGHWGMSIRTKSVAPLLTEFWAR